MIGDQLQKAIYSALTGASICSGHIYDRVPKSATFPYVTIGDDDVIDDSNSCGDAYEVFPKIHVWSRSPAESKLELKNIVAEIVPTIVGLSSVTDFTIVLSEFQGCSTIRDPDGLTEHAVLTFRLLLDPAS